MLMVSTAPQTPSPCRRTCPLWPGSEAALALTGLLWQQTGGERSLLGTQTEDGPWVKVQG